jgi:hypothetical protein
MVRVLSENLLRSLETCRELQLANVLNQTVPCSRERERPTLLVLLIFTVPDDLTKERPILGAQWLRHGYLFRLNRLGRPEKIDSYAGGSL